MAQPEVKPVPPHAAVRIGRTRMRGIAEVRRQNLLGLLEQHTHQMRDAGVVRGHVQAFAARLQIDPSLLAHFKAGRTITDQTARNIESRLGLTDFWLDTPHSEARPVRPESAGEERFVRLALLAYRCTSPSGRNVLESVVASLAAEHTSVNAVDEVPEPERCIDADRQR